MANFGNNGVMPIGWNGDESALHQTGPMRRGGGRFNQRSGPYDRRQPRTGGPSGRLTPPRGLPAIPMGGMRPSSRQWGDGAGAAAVGPQEAVQGRSLKSYQDLDAVGGSQGGELNY